MQDKNDCISCIGEEDDDGTSSLSLDSLNDSQARAILAVLKKFSCTHRSSVELIWGPPGTGKTKTTSTLLFALLKCKHRTLVCAPTNIAIKEISSRVLKMIREYPGHDMSSSCGPGDVLIFGNKDRLKIDLNSDIEDIFLDYRVKCLMGFFAPNTGWRHCLTSVSGFLTDCVLLYDIFCQNKQENKIGSQPFLDFFRERLISTSRQLRECISILCTHIPSSILPWTVVEEASALLALVDSFKSMLFQPQLNSKELRKAFSSHLTTFDSPVSGTSADTLTVLRCTRFKCISASDSLLESIKSLRLPNSTSKEVLMNLCYKSTRLIFCTAASSHKLHRYMDDAPLKYLIIDEAAQLKECESVIPLQLPGIMHALLVGDERQLPSMVESKVCL